MRAGRFYKFVFPLVSIAVILSIVFTSFNTLTVPITNAKVAVSSSKWQTVYRDSNYYDVYKIESGDTIIGVYAENQSGERVQDPYMELMLVLDAATLDKENEIQVLGDFTATSIGFNNWDNYSWGTTYLIDDNGSTIFLDAPAFYDYAYGYSNFTQTDIWEDGTYCDLWWLCDGLEDVDHRSELYADVILALIIQNLINSESSLETYELARDQLEITREELKGNQAAVNLINAMLAYTDSTIDSAAEIGAISTVFSKSASSTLGKASAWLSLVGTIFSGANLINSVKAHNLFFTFQFEYAMGGAEQRLEDLTLYLCKAEYCTETQQNSNPMIKGLEIAKDRFANLKLEHKEDLQYLLEDPDVKISLVDFSASLLETTLAVLKLTKVLKVSNVTLGVVNLAIVAIELKIEADLEVQDGLDDLRKIVLFYKLYRTIRDDFYTIQGDIRFKLSLLNIAYYSLFMYFYDIGERIEGYAYPYSSNPRDGWIFERDSALCYDEVTTGGCTRDVIRDQEFPYGLAAATTNYNLTRNGHYLSQSERDSWKSLILPYNGVPSLSSPSVTPINGNPSTDFIFSVVFSHGSNIKAEEVSIVVDGDKYPLTLVEGIPLIGVEYTITLSGFDIGVHDYYFEAIVGDEVVETDDLSFSVMETSEGHDLMLFNAELSDTKAKPGESVTVGAEVHNIGDYQEDNITIEVNITGPGNPWSDSIDIGSLDPLGGNYIWRDDGLTTWIIPDNAPNGDYSVNVTVSSPNGDENWSDNTRIRSVRVSDEEPAYSAYSYKFHQVEWTSDHEISYWLGDLMGPAYTSYDGKQYKIYIHPRSDCSDFRAHIESDEGEIIGLYDKEYDINTGYYEDNDDLSFSISFCGDDIAVIRLGHPVTGASIAPAEQDIPMGENDTYEVHLPCSSCGFDNSAMVFEGDNSDNPEPYFDRDLVDDENWDVDENGADFTITAYPWATDTRNFVFMTEKDDLTTLNYMVFGKITGYYPPDYFPNVEITYPNDQQTVYDSIPIAATAFDDRGISKVEFLVDGVIEYIDTSSPFIYSWDTTHHGDGIHFISTIVYDTANQTNTHEISITLDNLPPNIDNITHSPQNPTNLDAVTVQATITDISQIAIVNLYYSSNDGGSWEKIPMVNISGSVWQGVVPDHNQGYILYKIEATDALGRTAVTANYSYFVTDATDPTFYGWIESPSNLDADHVGVFRVTVTVYDIGGSGLEGQVAQFDYYIDSDSYDGYEDMVNQGGNTWSFDIPSQNWRSLVRSTIYYRVKIFDNAGNEGTSPEQKEYIDYPCYSFAVIANGTGTVPTVTPDKSSECVTNYYAAGEIIQLSGASPDPGWHIESWTGTDNDSSTASSNTSTMPARDHTASVNYSPDSPICYTLSLTYTGIGSKPIASPSNSAGCPTDRYYAGEPIFLTPKPASGYHLDYWTGTEHPSSNHLTMPESSWTVKAHYGQDTHSTEYSIYIPFTLK